MKFKNNSLTRSEIASSIFPRFKPGARITFAGGATTELACGMLPPLPLATGMKPASMAVSGTKHRRYSTTDGAERNSTQKHSIHRTIDGVISNFWHARNHFRFSYKTLI